MTRPSHRRRSRPRRPALADARRRRRRSPPPPISSATAPISTACRNGRASAVMPPTTASSSTARASRSISPPRVRTSQWSPAAIPASSPWRPRCSRPSRAAIPTWRGLDDSRRARHHGDARGRGPRRRAARRRFLRHVALGQPEALGGRRGAARGGARRRFRGRALQPDLVGPALAARRGACKIVGDDARPRHAGHSSHAPWAAGRADQRSCRSPRSEASMADMATIVIIGATHDAADRAAGRRGALRLHAAVLRGAGREDVRANQERPRRSQPPRRHRACPAAPRR